MTKATSVKLTKAEEYDQDYIDANSIFPDDDDGFLEASCGMTGTGHCELAGTEWCDWRCPVSREATHNQVCAKKPKATSLFPAGRAALAKEKKDE